jgi:hypothetical protein
VQTHRLVCHPNTPARAVQSISVQIELVGPDTVTLNFHVVGEIGALKIPARGPGRPTDNLWKQTCFEMFSRCVYHPDAYEELNLSPSTDWACYEFIAYRRGMAVMEALPPEIEVFQDPNALRLTAKAALAEGRGPWHVALSAIIEETDGTKSYWALRHPPSPPDFHHPDCFALELAAPDLT